MAPTISPHSYTGLRGLRVRAETGLGGRVLTTARPAKVTDYRSARSITHDYDRPC